MKYFFAFLILTATTLAATLNVPAQYATIQQAVNAAVAGDTVLVAAGTYDETILTVANGTANARITIDGQGAATVKRARLNKEYITLRGFTIKGHTTNYNALLEFERGAHWAIVEACTVDAEVRSSIYGVRWSAPSTQPFGTDAASDCVMQRCTVKNVWGGPMVSIFGDRNLIFNNTLKDGAVIDFFRLWGRNNIIRGNTCTNNYDIPNSGNHPDFIQTFGDNGYGSKDHIIEQNFLAGFVAGVEGTGMQLTQLTGDLNAELKDWTFRNNVFTNVKLSASCTMPGVQYLNNVFYRCGDGAGTHVLNFGRRGYDINSSFSSANNAGNPYIAAMSAPVASGALVEGEYYVVDTPLVPSGSIESGKPYIVSGTVTYMGTTYTNRQVFTGGATTTYTPASGGAVYNGGTVTYNGQDYRRIISQIPVFQATSTATFTVSDPAVRVFLRKYNSADDCVVKNNLFLACGGGGSTYGWYSFDLSLTGVSADYNMVTKAGFVPVRANPSPQVIGVVPWDNNKFYEVNGINGGDPLVVDFSNSDFRPLAGSPLIDQGVVLAGVTNDFINTVRPLGSAPDIGAYEYDDGSPPPDPPAPGTPPDAPSGLSATAGSDTTILLEWTDNADDEAYFELDRSLNGSSWTTTNQIDADTAAHVVAGLNASTLYYFRLRAVNGDGNSAYTATASATTQAPPVVGTPPTAPSNFQTTAIGAHSISMAWDDNSADETGFQIDCSPDGVAWSTIANLAANMESWTNSGLAAATTYYYRVRAVNSYGNSAWSNDDATTTAASPPSSPARAQSARGDLIGQ